MTTLDTVDDHPLCASVSHHSGGGLTITLHWGSPHTGLLKSILSDALDDGYIPCEVNRDVHSSEVVVSLAPRDSLGASADDLDVLIR